MAGVFTQGPARVAHGHRVRGFREAGRQYPLCERDRGTEPGTI